MITAPGIAALELVIADHPNVFNAVARETLEELLKVYKTERFTVAGVDVRGVAGVPPGEVFFIEDTGRVHRLVNLDKGETP